MTTMYRRLTCGLSDVGKFINVSENVYSHIKNYNQDHYLSVFEYTEEQKAEAEKLVEVTKNNQTYTRPKGVAGIRDVATKQLIFDFDSENIEIARKDTIKLCETLLKNQITEEAINICFSGNKGFSVVVDTDEYMTPDEVRSVCRNLAKDCETLDPVIYNASRIFRVPLTKHQKSFLYKKPLDLESLKQCDINTIKEYAKENDIDPNSISFPTVKLPPQIQRLKTEDLVVRNDKKEVDVVDSIQNIDFSQRLTFLTPEKYVLHCGHFAEGERSVAFMILASSYKKAGFTQGDAYRLLKSVAEKQSEIHHSNRFPDEELWNNIIGTVYSDSWQGGTYSTDHPLLQKINANLPEYLKRKKEKDLVDGNFIFSEFQEFIKDREKNTLTFGIPSIDKKLELYTGTSFGILGIPSSGKTTLALNLLAHNSQKGETSIFYSLDMNASLIANKLIQRNTGFNNRQIEELYKKDIKKYMDLQKQAIEEFKNVQYSFKYGLSPADIREDIDKFEQAQGKKVRLVVVDYLENVQSGYSDPTVGAGAVAQQLANIAADQKVLMVILLQTQKHIQPGEPITSMRSIKGASVIEQSLSVAIGIHRPGHRQEYNDYDRFMTIHTIKNRFGRNHEMSVNWDGQKGIISEMNATDKLGLQDLVEMVQEDQEEERSERRETWY